MNKSSNNNHSTVQRLSFVAPAGKLGLLLVNRSGNNDADNSNEDVGKSEEELGTCVYGVRQNSPLLHKLNAGDIIVGIDDQNVSQMHMDEVMDVLAKKRTQEKRMIHIWRTATPKHKHSPPASKKHSLSGGAPDAGLSSLGPPATSHHYQDASLRQEQHEKHNNHNNDGRVAINVSSAENDPKGESDNSRMSSPMEISEEVMTVIATPIMPMTAGATTTATTVVPPPDTLSPNGIVSLRSIEPKNIRKTVLIWMGVLILVMGVGGAIVAVLALKGGGSDGGGNNSTADETDEPSSDDDHQEESKMNIKFLFTTGTLHLAGSKTSFDIQLGGSSNACSQRVLSPPDSGMSKSYTLICPKGTPVSPMTLTALDTDGWFIKELQVQADAGSFTPMTPREIWCDKKPHDAASYYEGKPYQEVIQFQTTTATSPPTIPQIESTTNALLALYADASGINWVKNKNWASNKDVCDWQGVSCNKNGQVTDLDLYENNLSGSISSEIGNLVSLTLLNLSNNNLVGTLPTQLGALTMLEYMSICVNEIHGGIPIQLGQLTRLTALHLFGNDLTGNIPTLIGNLINLNSLVLSSNALNGPVPSQLEYLTMLKWLAFEYNELTGTLPSQLGKMTNIDDLSFGSNMISGTIPSELKALQNAETLSLGWNLLQDTIPSWFGSLTKLKYLSLYVNDLYGKIPTQLGNLRYLEYLHLWSNDLTGRIPSELGKLTKLEWLWSQRNDLTGPIPPQLQHLGKLEDLDLSGNDFSLGIPSQLGLISHLTDLDLNSNAKLGGNMSTQLGQLSKLQSLDLSGCSLTGEIPSEMGHALMLEFLTLTDNLLQGTIPSELGQLALLSTLDLSSNDFTGTVPDEICSIGGSSSDLYFKVDCNVYCTCCDGPSGC